MLVLVPVFSCAVLAAACGSALARGSDDGGGRNDSTLWRGTSTFGCAAGLGRIEPVGLAGEAAPGTFGEGARGGAGEAADVGRGFAALPCEAAPPGLDLRRWLAS